MQVLHRSLHVVNTYRIHVIAVFVLLLITYITPFFSSLYAPQIQNTPLYWGVILIFTLLWAGSYIGNKYFDYAEDSISQATEARKSAALAYVVTALYITPLLLLFWFGLPILPYLALVILTLGYSVPIAGTRIKKLFLLKNLYAAGAWWITIAVALTFYSSSGWSLLESMQYTYVVFLILMVFELLWDIRDIAGDRAVGNMTVPAVLGVPITKLIILALLGAFWWWDDVALFSILFLNLLYLSLVTLFVKTDFPNYYYHSVIYVQALFLLVPIIIYF